MINTKLSGTDNSAPRPEGNRSFDAVQQRVVQPPVDIVEHAEGILLWMDLPGVSPDRLDLQVHDANLYIKAEAAAAAENDLRLHHAELPVPRFARTFTLSSEFDTERIEANLKDGVLHVTIPRHEKARPRRIDVKRG